MKRYAELLNTVLPEENVLAQVDGLAAQIALEIPRDRTRWGQSASGWEGAVERLRNYVKNGARRDRAVADLRNYFSLSDAEMQAYFG